MYENIIDTIGFVQQTDPEVGDAMAKELARQKRNLELIASENIVSPAVMAAMGSVLTNKYAEATPERDITAAARTLISLRPLLSKEPRSFSEQSMQTFRLIRAHRQIQLFMWLSLHPVIL